MRINSSILALTAASILAAAPIPIAWATNVSGTIVNQVWTTNNAPYQVVGDILVAGLQIEPGVRVLFQGNYVFEVAGKLKALGTADMPIIFTQTNDSGGWQGIFFNFSSPGSIMEYCRVEHAVNSGIRISDSHPSLWNCVIANNTSASGGGGISASISTGDLVITGCTIATNSATRANGGGINAEMGTGTLYLMGCSISDNLSSISDANVVGGGVRLQGNGRFAHCTIARNRVEARERIPGGSSTARGGGIYGSGGSLALANCSLRANVAYGSAPGGMQGNAGYAYGGGIFAAEIDVSLNNSIISDNSVSGSHGTGGAGTYSDGDVLSAVNCTLTSNNTVAIQQTNGAEVTVRNSILFFNNSNDSQVSGTLAVTYSDVQGGFAGAGNINGNPLLLSSDDLILVDGSPCIDRGSTNTVDDDVGFPPSLGGLRNDIGAHGGPGARARLLPHLGQQFEIVCFGSVPGYTYQLQATTDLSTTASGWQTVSEFTNVHVGDIVTFREPLTNTLPRRFYRLNLAP